ncbi:hypothetical protein [Rubrivivax gelatinosus]|nr:hypothetical protein [Rubrivivax gelatinosus]
MNPLPRPSMIRVSGLMTAAVLVAACLPGVVRSAPAELPSATGDVRPAPAAGPSSAAATPGAEVVPGTSATIKLLLDLQTAQPSATPAESQRPTRSATGLRAASQPRLESGVGDLSDAENSRNTNSENGPPPSVSWSTSPPPANPEAGTAPKPEARPSMLRSMVSYLREHRLQVFVGGLAILALAAIGTIVSTRRQRTGRRVTADRIPPSRPRRSGAVRPR